MRGDTATKIKLYFVWPPPWELINEGTQNNVSMTISRNRENKRLRGEMQCILEVHAAH